MGIKSLGYRTDSFFAKYNGSVVDKTEYFVIKTPSNPNFFWGNLLLFKNPPEKGDFKKWKKMFTSEFSELDVNHFTFGWDSPTAELGDVEEFTRNGFELDVAIVLTTSRVEEPPKFNTNVKVRSLITDDEFEQAIQIQIECGGASLSKESWEGFYRSQSKQYREMISNDLGIWFGAFIEDELVGSLGLFFDKNIGRFQIVSTKPSMQRQGVCSSLVYNSAKWAIEKRNLQNLVMVADEDYHAAKIYESVGFRPTEKQTGLCWWDKKVHS